MSSEILIRNETNDDIEAITDVTIAQRSMGVWLVTLLFPRYPFATVHRIGSGLALFRSCRNTSARVLERR